VRIVRKLSADWFDILFGASSQLTKGSRNITPGGQENRVHGQRSYKSLEDLPPDVAEKLPCPKEYGDECPTKVRLKREVIVWGVPLKAHTIASDWEEDRNRNSLHLSS
jgi:hypothetical protein